MGPESLPTCGECRTHVDTRGRKSLTEITRTSFRKGDACRIFGWTRPSPSPLATSASFNSTPYASTPILKGNRLPLSVPRRSSPPPHPAGLTIHGCSDRSLSWTISRDTNTTRLPICWEARSVFRSRSYSRARKRLREMLHEFPREKARDERMTRVKMRSRSAEALFRG
jgi:hypothetical protein